jgi:FkbM family methyltransferase
MGAGLGLVGAIVAKKAAPEAVLSFEANPNLIPHIRALYTLNRLQDKITLRNQVVISAPDRPETLPFHLRNSFLGSSLIDSDMRETTQVQVPTASFDDVRRSFKPDVLLMDIEGGELEFLRHAALDGLRAVVMEFHPEAYGREGMRECKRILERAGFRKSPGHCTRQVWACIFDPAERPAASLALLLRAARTAGTRVGRARSPRPSRPARSATRTHTGARAPPRAAHRRGSNRGSTAAPTT